MEPCNPSSTPAFSQFRIIKDSGFFSLCLLSLKELNEGQRMSLQELSRQLSLSCEAQPRMPSASEHFQGSQQPYRPIGNLWGDSCLSQTLEVSAGRW